MNVVEHGNLFFVSQGGPVRQYSTLPAATYVIRFDNKNERFFLEKIDNFNVPSRLYGNTGKLRDRIFNTFMCRGHSTGVLMVGERGSGKTLLGKVLSLEFIKNGMPVLIVNEPHHGEDFNRFVQTIEQPCMFMWDEYDKVYKAEIQESLLTLLDGIYSSKKVFAFTANDKMKINPLLTNRPSRVFYNLHFVGLEETFIRDYCADNLDNKKQVDGVVRVAQLFEEFNFDMLKSLVEEMNRYFETAVEAIKYLNAKPDISNYPKSHTVKLTTTAGKKIAGTIPASVYVNPLKTSGISIPCMISKTKEKEYVFGIEDIVSVNNDVGEYVYEKDRVRLVLTRNSERSYDFQEHAKAYAD